MSHLRRVEDLTNVATSNNCSGDDHILAGGVPLDDLSSNWATYEEQSRGEPVGSTR